MVRPSVWFWTKRQTGRERLRLICFPYAGGSSAVYRSWPDQLPPEVQVVAVQLPGREERIGEPAFTRLEPLVQALMDALKPWLDMPYALFGHSMGALVAYALAQRLRVQPVRQPVRLLVSGRFPPSVPDPDEPMHALPEPELLERLQELNGIPPEILAHPELLQLVLPTVRADFELVETITYEEQPPLLIPISAFGGLSDVEASREDLAAWQQHTHAGFSLRMLPGDHFFIRTARPMLLEAIARDLLSS